MSGLLRLKKLFSTVNVFFGALLTKHSGASRSLCHPAGLTVAQRGDAFGASATEILAFLTRFSRINYRFRYCNNIWKVWDTLITSNKLACPSLDAALSQLNQFGRTLANAVNTFRYSITDHAGVGHARVTELNVSRFIP